MKYSRDIEQRRAGESETRAVGEPRRWGPRGALRVVTAAVLLSIVVVAASCTIEQAQRSARSIDLFYATSEGRVSAHGGFKTDPDDVLRGRMSGDYDGHTVGVSWSPFAFLPDPDVARTNELLSRVLRARAEEQPKYIVDEPTSDSLPAEAGASAERSSDVPAVSTPAVEAPQDCGSCPATGAGADAVTAAPAPVATPEQHVEAHDLADGRVVIVVDGCAEIFDPLEPFRAPRELPFVTERATPPASAVTVPEPVPVDSKPLWIAGGTIAVVIGAAVALSIRRELALRESRARLTREIRAEVDDLEKRLAELKDDNRDGAVAPTT